MGGPGQELLDRGDELLAIDDPIAVTIELAKQMPGDELGPELKRPLERRHRDLASGVGDLAERRGQLGQLVLDIGVVALAVHACAFLHGFTGRFEPT